MGVKRRQILDSLQAAIGKLPDRYGIPQLDIQISDNLKTNQYTRFTISFTAAENEKVSAYLYVPIQKGKLKKFPAMLALHETDRSHW